jgi:uncharacterized membrane protein
MGKKNRFAMLEIEPKQKDKSLVKDSTSTSTSAKAEEMNDQYPRPNDFKIIIDNENFEKNLQKHRMKDQNKALEIQKKEIKFKILDIRKKAIFKIGLGVLIVAFALRNFIIPDERVDGSVLVITHHYMSKKDIGVICLIVFSIWYYFSNKKKKE